MSASVVNAIKVKYATLTATLWPGGSRWAIYYGKAPVKDGSGNQVRSRYVVFKADTFVPRFQSDESAVEVGSATFTFYDFDVGDLATAVRAFKWNGQRPKLRAGMDRASLTLPDPEYGIDMMRTGEEVSYVADDKDGKRVHAVSLSYKLTAAVEPNTTPA